MGGVVLAARASELPIADRPLIEHTRGWLERSGVAEGDERLVLVDGDVFCDFDLGVLGAPGGSGAPATIAVVRAETGGARPVVLGDAGGRVTALQHVGDPDEALSDLVDAGVCVCGPDALDYLGGAMPASVAELVTALLAHDAPVRAVEVGGTWIAVDSADGLRRATFAALGGELRGTALGEGLVVGDGTTLDGVAFIEPPVWIGDDVRLGEHVSLHGPVAIGDGARVGDGAELRAVVVLPGASVERGAVVAGAVVGGLSTAGAPRSR